MKLCVRSHSLAKLFINIITPLFAYSFTPFRRLASSLILPFNFLSFHLIISGCLVTGREGPFSHVSLFLHTITTLSTCHGSQNVNSFHCLLIRLLWLVHFLLKVEAFDVKLFYMISVKNILEHPIFLAGCPIFLIKHAPQCLLHANLVLFKAIKDLFFDQILFEVGNQNSLGLRQ